MRYLLHRAFVAGWSTWHMIRCLIKYPDLRRLLLRSTLNPDAAKLAVEEYFQREGILLEEGGEPYGAYRPPSL